MGSRVGKTSMYIRPPVSVWSFSNHCKMATGWWKMVTVCSYEAHAHAKVSARVSVCPHTKLHGVTSQKSIMPTVATMRTSNLTIILFLCLLTSQSVSSAHSVCTTYSTERGMNATWLSLSRAFRSSRMWHVITQVVPTSEGINKHNGTTFLWYVQNYSPNDTASQPRQPESSARTLWEPHTLTTSSHSAM